MAWDEESRELVTVDYDRVIKKTDRSWIFAIDREDVIIPESEMENGAPDEDDNTFSIPRWLAEDRGLV